MCFYKTVSVIEQYKEFTSFTDTGVNGEVELHDYVRPLFPA